MSVYDLGVDIPATLADAAHRAHDRGDDAAQQAAEDAALRLRLGAQTPAAGGRWGRTSPAAGHRRKPDYRTDPR